jgi:hypothetical protein
MLLLPVGSAGGFEFVPNSPNPIWIFDMAIVIWIEMLTHPLIV